MNVRLEVSDAIGHRTVPVEKPNFSIGRRSTNDLRVGGSDVSRDHAEIVREGDRFVLYDRTSRYGTFVNGEQIAERELAHGDRIRLGRSGEAEMVFLTEAEEAPRPPERHTTSAVSDLRQISVLLEGLRALSASRVLDDVLALVLDSAIEVTSAERGFIMLGNDEGVLEFKMARARGRISLTGNRFETSRKIPEEVFATGREVLVADMLDGDLAGVHTGTVALGIRTVLCVPLKFMRFAEERASADEQMKTIGVLHLDSKERGTLLSRGARTALETLAAEAAVAIENARMYREALVSAQRDQELRVAAEMQQALLPRGTRVGDFYEAAAVTIPCRSIGGDFFDYHEAAGGFGFAVADVAGKGAPAALMTAVLQGMFSAQAGSEQLPAATFARVNNALAHRAVEARFATMIYAALRPDGTLVYSNAGHNPPFLIKPDGSFRRLETGGLILGLFEGARYDEETVQLEEGDVLVFFSDGVSEALSPTDEEFGDDRLLATVREHVAQDPAAALLDRLLFAVKSFAAGRPQSDDVTAMVVRYRHQ